MSRALQRRLSLVREHRAWTLHLQGWSSVRIARDVGVTDRAVRKWLARLEDQFRERHRDDVRAWKLTQLARLEALLSELHEAWELSKKGRTRKSLRSSGQGTAADISSAVTTDDRPGDPAVAKEIRMVLAEINKLLGLYAPIKLEHTVNPERPFEDLSEPELRAQLAQAAALLAAPTTH